MATLTEEDFLDQSLRNAYPAFRFSLEIANSYAGLFSECTLPNVEWEVEEIKEGGLNSYIHQLPGQRKSSSRVVLKTGVLKGPLTALYQWYINSMDAKFSRKAVTIKLLDSDGQTAIMTWALEDAYPVKWTAPQLKADSNALAINTLELACGRITVKCE
jgi:phage tail-like protein